MNQKMQLAETLIKKLPELTFGQLHWIQRVISVFSQDHTFNIHKSDLFDDEVLRNFGESMRIHHSFSAEPFSKDKFEYVLVTVLKTSGKIAELAPKGNPGHDATVNGIKISLKTQADKGISKNKLWISKFMELGKGDWTNSRKNLSGLRDQFFKHMQSYERIFSLRTLSKGPNWSYELVEIPKCLLIRAKDGRMEMKRKSLQNPKPGYCYVDDDDGRLFELYFDGGTERKLQIKNLRKDACIVHASWEFFIPPE